VHKLVTYYGADGKGAHLPFNFSLLNIEWNAARVAATIDEYEGALPADGWPNWVLGNHDQPRISSRMGREQARVAAMLLLTLRGTPTIYYGEELGMKDVAIPQEEVQDPQGLNMPGKNLSRDPARTPMQWDQSAHAGFTRGNPWLRLSRDTERNNVAVQMQDSHSMLQFYRRLIAFRQSHPSMVSGSYKTVFADHQVLAYQREADGHAGFLIILNLTHRPCYFSLEGSKLSGTVCLATTPEREGEAFSGRLELDGDEGLIVQLLDNAE
ncbi:MAG: DUF3459 domain-containing protein, partial [Sphingobacteriales bacterium]